MPYFNYHAKAKKLIKEGFLKGYSIVGEYNKIKPAMVLFFTNHRPMPIREHRWKEYLELIKQIDTQNIKKF